MKVYVFDRGYERLDLQLSIIFHRKVKAGYVDGFKPFVERIGSLLSTREAVATDFVLG